MDGCDSHLCMVGGINTCVLHYPSVAVVYMRARSMHARPHAHEGRPCIRGACERSHRSGISLWEAHEVKTRCAHIISNGSAISAHGTGVHKGTWVLGAWCRELRLPSAMAPPSPPTAGVLGDPVVPAVSPLLVTTAAARAAQKC